MSSGTKSVNKSKSDQSRSGDRSDHLDDTITARDRELIGIFQQRYLEKIGSKTAEVGSNTNVTFSSKLANDIDTIVGIYKKDELKELHTVLGMVVHSRDQQK